MRIHVEGLFMHDASVHRFFILGPLPARMQLCGAVIHSFGPLPGMDLEHGVVRFGLLNLLPVLHAAKYSLTCKARREVMHLMGIADASQYSLMCKAGREVMHLMVLQMLLSDN